MLDCVAQSVLHGVPRFSCVPGFALFDLILCLVILDWMLSYDARYFILFYTEYFVYIFIFLFGPFFCFFYPVLLCFVIYTSD